MTMKKLLIPIIALILMGSLCMCVEKRSSLYDYSNTKVLTVDINGTPVQLELRTTVGEALSTNLINTNDKDIKNYYLAHKIIYFEYNKSLPSEEGGVSIVDLALKLKFLNPIYPHYIVDETVFKNESEVNKIKNSNKTMIIKIIRGNRSATIEKINNTFIIEGNSLKELDKAESRFILAIYTNPKDKYYISLT
jgi:hypothetical protein